MEATPLTLILITAAVAALALVALLTAMRPRSPGPAGDDTVEVATLAPDGIAPAPEDAAIVLPPADGPPDRLTTLKGLGPKASAQLEGLGIIRFDQLAALDPDQAAWLDMRMGNFRGRLARDRWIDQARMLAAGDTTAYEAEFGRLG